MGKREKLMGWNGLDERLKWNLQNLYLISSSTVGICEWRVELKTYQGVSRIARRTLDRNVWIRAKFEGLADHHSSIPYVQVGFSIVLYIVSL